MDVRAPHFAPATAPVPTSAADARAIEVRLVPVVRVRGRLLSADGTALTGTAQIVGPERHAYHSVRSTHPNGDSHEVSSGDEDLLVNTGRDGRFDVEGLRSDGGDLVLFADGFAPLRRRALRGDQGDVDLGDLTLDAGADVRGVVVDAASRPISGAWVEIEGGDADSVIACGETDAHGAFVLPHIGLGGHTVVASWSDGGADSQRREGKAVGVRAGASAVRVVLVGGLTVRFFFAGTSTPLPTSSATISVAAIDERGDSTSSSVHSNGHAMNRIRLESGAGRFDVAIEIPGYDKVEFKDVPVLTVEETILDAQFRVSSK